MIWKLNEWPTVNNLARLNNQTLADVREDWVLQKDEVRSVKDETAASAKAEAPRAEIRPSSFVLRPLREEAK